jgi:hypothetical protein
MAKHNSPGGNMRQGPMPMQSAVRQPSPSSDTERIEKILTWPEHVQHLIMLQKEDTASDTSFNWQD